MTNIAYVRLCALRPEAYNELAYQARVVFECAQALAEAGEDLLAADRKALDRLFEDFEQAKRGLDAVLTLFPLDNKLEAVTHRERIYMADLAGKWGKDYTDEEEEKPLDFGGITLL
jgi:hypothetical protein